MQLCDIQLRIAGSLNHVVPKQDVTPAEILVLRRLHGDDAVIDIRPTRQDKRQHSFEWDRLVAMYGQNGSSSTDGQSVLLNDLFPGAIKKLPVSLAEIEQGIVEPEEVDDKAEA